jgi:hypothetical protein
MLLRHRGRCRINSVISQREFAVNSWLPVAASGIAVITVFFTPKVKHGVATVGNSDQVTGKSQLPVTDKSSIFRRWLL